MDAVWWLMLLILAGGGLGRVARGLWRSKDESCLDRFVLDVSMGLGMLSLVFFAMAALHVISAPGSGMIRPFIVMVAVGLILGMVLIVGNEMPLVATWIKQKRLPSAATVIWVVIFVCLAGAVLIPALAPPSSSDWDSLAYHLAIPKLYLEHHGFYYIDFSSHSNFPFLVEMLYTPALSLNDPSGAKMVHYLYGVLLILAVVMLVRKHFTPKAAPLAALAIAGMPIVLWEATTAYIDLATALYTVLAVYFLLNYLDSADRRSLIGCAIAAGFAASTKMTGLALIPLLLVWLLIDRFAADRRIEWKHGLMFVGIALLACSPWYLKTLIYTGNSVYPFFYSIFGGRDWTAQLAHGYATSQAKFGMGHGLASFIMLPYDLAFFWAEFCDRGQVLIVGPILLVAAPLLLLARYSSRKLIGLTLFFFAQLAIWFVLTQQSRYLIPSFAILAIVIAGIAYTDDRLRIARIALYVTFAATAVFGVLMLGFQIVTTAPVVFGSESQDQYLSKTLPIYATEKWINDHAPPKAKIALFGDTRGFYLNRDYVWADWGHNKRFTRSFTSVDDFITYLKSQGITYAMVDSRWMPAPDKANGTYECVYQAIRASRFELVHTGMASYDSDTSISVYKIK